MTGYSFDFVAIDCGCRDSCGEQAAADSDPCGPPYSNGGMEVLAFMSGAGRTAADGFSRLHRAARKQVDFARDGEWEKVSALMQDRMDRSCAMGEPLPEVLRPLRELCLMIDQLDEQLEQILEQGREATLRQMAQLQLNRRTIGAYHPPEMPERPRYLDEKK